MNSYKVKNYMWVVIIAMFLIIFALSGCSSAPRRSEQFCDLKTETIVDKDKDGKVINESTRERMVCNDNKIDRISIKQAGVASNCGESTDWIRTPSGKDIQIKTLVCQKFNGRWEIIPNYSPYN
jgi:hypothetical protein